MSDFLKLAWELISQVVYNIASWLWAIVNGFLKIFVTGWVEYASIFASYFVHFSLPLQILAVLLALVLIAIPVLILVVLVKWYALRLRLKADKTDNTELYKEIGRLNRQVLELMDEKNKILALKAGNAHGMPYMGATALADDETVATVGSMADKAAMTFSGGGYNVAPGSGGENGALANQTGGNGGAGGFGGQISGEDGGVMSNGIHTGGSVSGALDAGISINNIDSEALATAAAAMADASVEATAKANARLQGTAVRFPKLCSVDERYRDYLEPPYNNRITLQEFVEQYRNFAASRLHLYYDNEIIRRFVAGMASSRLLILEGISGTGKTSLPYSMSRFMQNPATIISVQPSYRDRTELMGYFNEFSKRFNETEFLRALYEANYRKDPNMIVLDEMNLARVEYYFAEMLSVLEMPSQDEWLLDLVPVAWDGDPAKLQNGKIFVPNTVWFIGTINNDDSTFSVTDKVYDRAIPIEINNRIPPFEAADTQPCAVTCVHLQAMFAEAKKEHPISQDTLDKMGQLNDYLLKHFKLTFGNRIVKQMYDFIPVYVACGGTELDGMDYIIARKVLKKFESMNIGFMKDEITDLIMYMEQLFGRKNMQDSRGYLLRIQNTY